MSHRMRRLWSEDTLLIALAGGSLAVLAVVQVVTMFSAPAHAPVAYVVVEEQPAPLMGERLGRGDHVEHIGGLPGSGWSDGYKPWPVDLIGIPGNEWYHEAVRQGADER